MVHLNAPPAEAPTVRVKGAQGIVAAVPAVLGFWPRNSVVLLCLSGERGRLGPAARVDIFPPRAHGAAESLVRCAERYAEAVILACFHDGERPPCLDIIIDALASHAIPVTAVLSVSSGMIRDARTAASARRDPGIAVPAADDAQSEALTAAAALAGRRVLADRADLVASIAAPDASAQADVREAIAASHLRFARLLDAATGTAGGGPVDAAMLTVPLSRAVDRTLTRARAEVDTAAGLSLRTAADFIVLTTPVGCRDRVLARCVSGGDPSVVSVLIAVARNCPDELAAQVCAVLAAAAYRFGDGALAHCALDRALAASPMHRLSRLLRAAVDAGLPPRDLDELAGVRYGDGANRATRRRARARPRQR